MTYTEFSGGDPGIINGPTVLRVEVAGLVAPDAPISGQLADATVDSPHSGQPDSFGAAALKNQAEVTR